MSSNYMNLLNQVSPQLKKHLRTIENVSNKIINRLWSKTFNKVCLKENIWPTYTHIKKDKRKNSVNVFIVCKNRHLKEERS